jgi:hypothetical protein
MDGRELVEIVNSMTEDERSYMVKMSTSDDLQKKIYSKI